MLANPTNTLISSGGRSGNQLWGASSWFGGPGDSSTGPTTASGAPTSQPGIAVYDRSTLGGWWMIKAPNGAVGLVKQTDIGPAPSTGRKFDYTYSLLPLFGYSQQNFPTNQQTYGVYLGKSTSDPSFAQALQKGFTTLGANAEQQAGLIQSLDAGAIMQGHSAVVVPPTQQPGQTLPQFGQTPSGSEAVPAGPDLSGLTSALGDMFNTAVGDAKYAAVLIGVLVVAVVLVTHGVTGSTPRPKLPV